MGLLLSVSVFLAFIYDPLNPGGLGLEPPIIEHRVETPELDPEILDQIEDGDRLSRLVVEAVPLSHLLEKSLQVVPSVAKALGLSKDPIPMARLRANPDAFRGHYLGYGGILRYLSPGREGHPIDGYQIREGWIETDDGEPVLFYISGSSSTRRPSPEVGEYVRVEGFFMKLRDKHLPDEVNQAPLLVGPEIYPDYKLWDPVENLDPTILAGIEDGTYADGEWSGFAEMENYLLDSQDIPLWHLTSYVLNQQERISPAAWMEIEPIASKEAFDQFRRSTPSSRNELRGQPHRILGSFIQGRTHEVAANPLGIEAWTEAWVQVRDIGGQLLPVWIPKRLQGLQRNALINCRAFFYRLMAYEALEGDFLYVPLFIASDLHKLEPRPEHPIVGIMKIVVVVVVGGIMLIFFSMSRRMKIQRIDHEQSMILRRRRRREKSDQLTGSGIDA